MTWQPAEWFGPSDDSTAANPICKHYDCLIRPSGYPQTNEVGAAYACSKMAGRIAKFSLVAVVLGKQVVSRAFETKPVKGVPHQRAVHVAARIATSPRL